jgi:hypothetical protein
VLGTHVGTLQLAVVAVVIVLIAVVGWYLMRRRK